MPNFHGEETEIEYAGEKKAEKHKGLKIRYISNRGICD
jgi:hypothetical protein